MTTLYPTYYGTDLVTMDGLEVRFKPRMHPEMWRRLSAWLIAQDGQIGIGGGFRLTQPDLPGFAPDGRSFHQAQRFASGFTGYCAVDLVARNTTGQRHRAPTWSEVPIQGSGQAAINGVHANVSTEPWHMQPVEIDGWASWRRPRWLGGLGRTDPVAGYPIPSPPPQKGDVVQVTVTTVREGDSGGWVRKLQVLLPTFSQEVGTADGSFGPRTKAGVINVQRFFNLTVDGIVGPRTWDVLFSAAPG